MSVSSDPILLQPRRYAQCPGKLLLLPLLPQQRPLKPLPCEIWSEIFAFAVADADGGRQVKSWALAFLTVCQNLKDTALPILYTNVEISDIDALDKFFKRLHVADQKWDSIPRIPYSAPGRWVQQLDLSKLAYENSKQTLLFDSLLTQLFPLTPLLQCISLNPSFVVSRRAISALAQREGCVHIRALHGFNYFKPLSQILDDDPFVQLLHRCPNIESLELIGQGLDLTEPNFTLDDTNTLEFAPHSFVPLNLPSLNTLALLSMHSSPLMLALLYSPIPALKKLTITPYADLPFPIGVTSEFISAHGATLRSLILMTPKSWPTRLHPSPTNLLESAPILRHLSLEKPLPHLMLGHVHPLQILSIPRPQAEFWPVLERLLRYLPHLQVVRIREVRWLKKGLSSTAQTAGVQGEMKEWRRRLLRRRIRVLDADWNDFE